MPEIALPAFHLNTTKKLTLEVSHDLEQDLERYRTFYKQAYGADVSEADLLREMARRFMDGDREFQVAKYGLSTRSRSPRRSTAHAAAPAPKAEP
jgi:hypothetical protein